jgi:hypothetical protein
MANWHFLVRNLPCMAESLPACAGFIVMDLARDPNATWSRTVRPLGGIRLAHGVHTRGDADSADESAGDNYNREGEDGGENEDDESADNDVEGADNDEKEKMNEGADDDEDGDVEGADNDEKENVNEGEGMVLVNSYTFIMPVRAIS